jgi:YebC/PmpR family DNA-binding regulatory protein
VIDLSGHSKWATIKRKKEVTDSKRAKIFTKIGRELAIAVREGGADAANNSKLRDIIAKAKSNNVPNDNIERIIKKSAGEAGGAAFEEIVYEGYGPSGVAVMVEALTDNRNRTAAELRHWFDKYGGNMGTSGCVSYMFTQYGVIVVDREGVDEDRLMEDALEAGGVDFLAEDEYFEIRTEPSDFSGILKVLEEKKYIIADAEIQFVPSTYTALTNEEDMAKMSKLLELLEDFDDVSEVWHNWEEN